MGFAITASAQHEYFLQDDLDKNKQALLAKLGVSKEIRNEYSFAKKRLKNEYVKYFDKQGRPVKSILLDLEDSSEMLLREYTYDTLGRLIRIFENIPYWTYTLSYDDKGRLLQVVVNDNLLGVYRDTFSYSYSPEGRVISGASPGSEGISPDEFSTYKYDEKGRLASKVTAGTDSISFYEYHCTYDEKGRLMATREYSGGDWRDHRFTYGPNGLLIEETSEGDSKLVYMLSYEY